MRVEKQTENEFIFVDNEKVAPIVYALLFALALIVIVLQTVKYPIIFSTGTVFFTLMLLGVLVVTLADIKKIRVTVDRVTKKITIHRTGLFRQNSEDYSFSHIKAIYVRWVIYFYRSGTSYSLFLSNGKEVTLTLAPYYWRFSFRPQIQIAETLGGFLDVPVQRKGFWLNLRSILNN